MPRKKAIDPIPAEFQSIEEAAEFWDTHETTDYLDHFKTVTMTGKLQRRHFEIEIDSDVLKALRAQARSKRVSSGKLAGDVLRRHFRRPGN